MWVFIKEEKSAAVDHRVLRGIEDFNIGAEQCVEAGSETTVLNQK